MFGPSCTRTACNVTPDGVVDALPVQPPDDLVPEHAVERLQAGHSSGFGDERSLHGDAALVAVAVVRRRLPEFGRVALVGPIRAPDAVRRGKLNDTRKVAGRHP